MRIRTPSDLGAALREQRRRRGLDQQTLAGTIGVGRQWVVEFEKGKPRAEVGLVLRALDAVGLALSLEPADTAVAPPEAAPADADIDRIVDEARETDP